MGTLLLRARLRKASLAGAARRILWGLAGRPWILGRHACLGADVLSLARPTTSVFNIQKGRVDRQLAVLSKPSLRARTAEIAPHLANPGILPFLLQQEHSGWLPSHPPSLVYMDSFSELADQLFVHRKGGWGFCSAYSDIAHGEGFASLFRVDGLLPEETLAEQYGRYFESLRTRYGRVPIVFLHFPSRLEKREKFLRRKEAIQDAIAAVASGFAPFHSIALNEAEVDWPEERPAGLEDFPYHYDRKTYASFRRRLETLGVLPA